MGSQGITRRKPRPRPPAAGDPAAAHGWELQNSPYTFEGEIEGLGRFGRGVRHASPRMKLLATIVALTFILPLVIWVLNMATD
jgi:hypothetical protein